MNGITEKYEMNVTVDSHLRTKTLPISRNAKAAIANDTSEAI